MSPPPEHHTEPLVRGYAGRLFLVVSLGWLILQGGRLMLSPLLPTITADLQLSNAQAGFAFTLMWALYASLQYPSGRLSDRLTRKTLLVTGLVLSVGGFALFGVATSYVWFLLGTAIVGLGVGFYATPVRGLVSDLYVERRGQAFGIHTAAGDLGGLLAAGLATLVIGVATWRWAYLPVVIAVMTVAVVLHVWGREPYDIRWVDLAVRETLGRLFGVARMRGLLVAYIMFVMAWQASTAFLPTFLLAEKGFPPAIANAGFAAYFLVGVVTKPVSGAIADRVPRGRFAAGMLALAGGTMAVVLAVEGIAAVGVGVILFALGLMAFPPIMQAYLMDTFPTDSMAGDLGGMRSLYIGIGSLGPTAVGLVADVASFSHAFAILAGLLAVAATIVLVVVR